MQVAAALCQGLSRRCAYTSRFVSTAITRRDLEIARTVGAACTRLGLALVGLDVIGEHLTEVNVTSPTGFRELERLTGTRLQERVVDWVIDRLAGQSAPVRAAA